ncbi:MAG TPA: hypothetical protein VHV51_10570, partial [Polyangiaceae bacterium]|nr:hypothetical protein [Polyangiaceae bacterium]
VGAAVCLVGGLVQSCLSPTLPLPPPSDPTVSGPDAQGNVRITGYVLPDSEVFVLNHRNNAIAGQLTNDGSYDFTIQAAQNDAMTIWYVQETVQSPTTDFVVTKAPGEP